MNSSVVSFELDWLSRAGIQIMKDNQAPTGAFLASPSFPVYRFSWLRDGSYVAMALSRAGERGASAAFHEWTASTIATMADRIALIVDSVRSGRPVDRDLLLPTRYLLSGELEDEGDDSWPTVQFDGYGTWLWALAAHLQGAAPSPAQHRAAQLAADYLEAVWTMPCYDYWEEFGDRQHTSTLAAIVAGLRAAAELTGVRRYAQVADEVWAFVTARCVREGSFVKGPEDDRVDASLASLGVPFGLVAPDDPVYLATLDRIESELTSPAGGVWRYLGDTYYGGGAWVLLTCWLGWARLVSGDRDRALEALAWARDAASETGRLPEQLTGDAFAQAPAYRQGWIENWGEPADPLLWSQAMYLLLDDALRRSVREGESA